MLIFDGIRSAFGRNAGSLATVRPDDLAGEIIAALLARGLTDPALIEDVVLGCSNQAGEDSRNIARHAALLAGLPVSVPGVTVNRLCGSGLAAIIDAGSRAASGAGDLFIAGGVESMSRGPFAFAKAEAPFSREIRVFDTSMGERFPNPRITELYGNDSMPETADNVARLHDITRQASDAFALQSQMRYRDADAAGFFTEEIHPISLPARRGASEQTVSTDEHPRPETTADRLAALKPLFPNGVVTAGSSSGVNDGAVALLIGNEAAAANTSLSPRARIVGHAVAGVEPRLMGLGPVPAINKALARAGLTLADMDVIEINEAFAAQLLGCLKALSITATDPRINPNGGAIALGHPLGASGARLMLTALRELERREAHYAVVAMCIGVGQGIAAVVERLT